MKGTVTAKSGSTVKLRQKPGTDCTIYWNIPVGTEVEIVDQRDNWSKCICSGLTGWMKNDFIGGLSARESHVDSHAHRGATVVALAHRTRHRSRGRCAGSRTARDIAGPPSAEPPSVGN